MAKPLSLTVTEVTDTFILATTSDGQRLRLPKEAVHGTPKPGQDLRLLAVAIGAEDAGKTDFARSLLNELLGPSA